MLKATGEVGIQWVTDLFQKPFLNLPDNKYRISSSLSWSETKLHIIDRHFTSYSLLNDSFKDLHHMIEQLYSVIRTTFQSITFPFIHLHHPTFLQSLGILLSCTILLHRSVTH